MTRRGAQTRLRALGFHPAKADNQRSHMSIPTIDLVIIVLYLVGVTAVGLLSVRRMKLTGEVYFLAGRALPWGVVGAEPRRRPLAP